MSWPPDAETFYLDGSESRPVFQGDVFEDVPFVKVKGGASPAHSPEIGCERRCVAPVLHPCDMYSEGGRRLRRVQSVALVTSAAGVRIPGNWDGAFSVCPLPDLFQDGETWIAHYTLLSNVDRSYLTLDRRVRSLSTIGWAVFQMRAALAMGRTGIDLDDLQRIGAATWHESILETVWKERGGSTADFHDWLDAADPNMAGMTRRRAIERGMYSAVAAALEQELRPA